MKGEKACHRGQSRQEQRTTSFTDGNTQGRTLRETTPLLAEGPLQDMQREVYAKTDQARDAPQGQSVERGTQRGKDTEGEYEPEEGREDAIDQHAPTPERPGDEGADADNGEMNAGDNIAADDALTLRSEEVATSSLDCQPLEAMLSTESVAGFLHEDYSGFGASHV